ncbi:YjgN family protein [Acetobacteraceae bacterium KSS8]|uniref:YjgN family protein n=1 Tax=Endosaccharibacter trunci TaxID=2812733 RepID=A0ABT1W7N8_9PROT|nr:YjgN family protein [Acetobacteraceae bacterium KSS8]
MIGDQHLEPGPFLRYDGRIAELYAIFLPNLALTIVTAGIWRFWGVTRIRRYVWSRTSHAGERFHYDGTGTELFVGFLLAMGIILGLFVLVMVAVGLSNSIGVKQLGKAAAVAFVVAWAVLAFGAPFSAQRYRLNHTLWCGIRGGMNGSMIVYGIQALLCRVAVGSTLFQLWPWSRLRLFERRINASFFGSQRFASRSSAMRLYGAGLVTGLAILLLFALACWMMWHFDARLLLILTKTEDRLRQDQALLLLLPLLVPMLLVFGIGATLLGCGFQACFLRQVADGTTLGGLRFSSDVRPWLVFRLLAGNMLIMFCTAGLGLPVVVHRRQCFLAVHLLSQGTLDPALLRQGAQTPSRFGEGMFQFLDAGAGLA